MGVVGGKYGYHWIFRQCRTVPKQAQFTCGNCGKNQDRLNATKSIKHSAPDGAYALQCFCPQCAVEGYNYGGRYFKALDTGDTIRINAAGKEWENRCEKDLAEYWPRMEIAYSMRTHVKEPLPDHGFTHWWMMFNPRQLLVHTKLLKAITEASGNSWSLDVKEQSLGAFQQYIRNQNMFCLWNKAADQLEPLFSNPNFNPKQTSIENAVFTKIGRGNWASCVEKVINAIDWMKNPKEPVIDESYTQTSYKIPLNDPLTCSETIFCTSSTNLYTYISDQYDLVITDPPFGNNLFYADLADFFYVWLRLPLKKLYANLPEQQYFKPDRTPHSMEAIDNPAEHPDDREDYEKFPLIKAKHLKQVRELTEDYELQEKDSNPLYHPQPSSDFYRQTLSACWAEAGHLLKDGGIMAFTFHHDDDQAWINVLRALFDAGYLLVATYPIRSDESKGESGQFGSKKIEYGSIWLKENRIRHHPRLPQTSGRTAASKMGTDAPLGQVRIPTT
jgi:adenine-specific DNA methylase